MIYLIYPHEQFAGLANLFDNSTDCIMINNLTSLYYTILYYCPIPYYTILQLSVSVLWRTFR